MSEWCRLFILPVAEIVVFGNIDEFVKSGIAEWQEFHTPDLDIDG
jgi:hypothetical protein